MSAISVAIYNQNNLEHKGNTLQLAVKLDTATFRPLPPELRIGPSTTEGQGLIATRHIPAEHHFGITHVFSNDKLLRQMFPDGWIRSPLGTWYNHSNRPNAQSIHIGSCLEPQPDDVKMLITLRTIEPGEEILVHYTLYRPVP